jgi:hypothetical protein
MGWEKRLERCVGFLKKKIFKQEKRKSERKRASGVVCLLFPTWANLGRKKKKKKPREGDIVKPHTHPPSSPPHRPQILLGNFFLQRIF